MTTIFGLTLAYYWWWRWTDINNNNNNKDDEDDDKNGSNEIKHEMLWHYFNVRKNYQRESDSQQKERERSPEI